MSLKNLTIGSMVLLAILVIFSLAANNAVDRTLSGADQAVEDTSGDQALRANLPHGSVSLDDAEKNPGLLKSLTQKFMQAIISMVDDQASQKSTLGTQSTTSTMTYDQMLEDYPLTDEELEQIRKYSGDQSPAELIQSYCEDSQTAEFQEMIDSIKESYGNDPESPAMLMDLYSSMAKFCPSQP